MLRIAIVTGSTRPGRRGNQVTRWVKALADARPEPSVTYDVIDIADFDLPLLDEPQPAAIGAYAHPHTLRWAETVGRYDGFVFVTPEYNHSIPAALKNAIDYLFAEWNDKAAGFVGYGLHGGQRAVEHLRLTLAEVKVAGVRSQVELSLFTDFAIEDMTRPGTFTPAPHHAGIVDRMLDDLTAWSGALQSLREVPVAAR